jgi:hypothetical protein
VQELVASDQKQSRASFGLNISVVNAAAMRPTAAILMETGTIYVVLPLAARQVCYFELDDIGSKGGVHVTSMLADGIKTRGRASWGMPSIRLTADDLTYASAAAPFCARC